jgi:hypothetical protein
MGAAGRLPGYDLVAEWREGPHGDLVLAVAIAVYEGEHLREPWLL